MAEEIEKSEEMDQDGTEVELEAATEEPVVPSEDEVASSEEATEPEPKIAVGASRKGELGLIRAMQEERRKTRELRQEVERLRTRPENSEGASTGDDLITRAELDAQLAEVETKLTKQQVDASQDAAKARHTEAKEGKGLGWNNAYDAFCELAEEDPLVADLILGNADPGEKLYEFVSKNHLGFAQKIATRKQAADTRRVAALTGEVVSSTGTPSGQEAGLSGDPFNMSLDQLRKLRDKIEGT